jgi:hypothetical protein
VQVIDPLLNGRVIAGLDVAYAVDEETATGGVIRSNNWLGKQLDGITGPFSAGPGQLLPRCGIRRKV